MNACEIQPIPGLSVVIPCYRVTRHIMAVINSMPELVERIYVVDDCCPDKSGEYILAQNKDLRVKFFLMKRIKVWGAP